MDEERKKLEAIGDDLLLAVARLYLREQSDVPYKVHMRLISRMVNNRTLAEIAEGEGIKGREGEKLSDAFEVAIAIRYFKHGFRDMRLWLSGLFDKYVDIAAEVRRILEPQPEDALTKSVRGTLRMVLGQQGGKITGSTLDLATKQIVSQLKNGNGANL